MKNILFTLVTLLFVTINYGQSASKNTEHCKAIESKKNVEHLNAIFDISPLSTEEKSDLESFLYKGNIYIYNIEFNQNNTIHIHHIDAVKVEFLKNLLNQFGCYINFNSIQTL